MGSKSNHSTWQRAVLPDRLPDSGDEGNYEYTYKDEMDQVHSPMGAHVDLTQPDSHDVFHQVARRDLDTNPIVASLLGVGGRNGGDRFFGRVVGDGDNFDAATIATTEFDDDEETLKLGETPPSDVKGSSSESTPSDFSSFLGDNNDNDDRIKVVDVKEKLLRRLDACQDLGGLNANSLA